jgi:hypothetical protein
MFTASSAAFLRSDLYLRLWDGGGPGEVDRGGSAVARSQKHKTGPLKRGPVVCFWEGCEGCRAGDGYVRA